MVHRPNEDERLVRRGVCRPEEVLCFREQACIGSDIQGVMELLVRFVGLQVNVLYVLAVRSVDGDGRIPNQIRFAVLYSCQRLPVTGYTTSDVPRMDRTKCRAATRRRPSYRA